MPVSVGGDPALVATLLLLGHPLVFNEYCGVDLCTPAQLVHVKSKISRMALIIGRTCDAVQQGAPPALAMVVRGLWRALLRWSGFEMGHMKPERKYIDPSPPRQTSGAFQKDGCCECGSSGHV